MMQNVIIFYTVIMTILSIGFTIYYICIHKFDEIKDLIKKFLFVFIVMLIGYGCLIWSKHYSVDSFNLVYDMGPYWHLQNGRYMNSGIILIALKFGINQVVCQQVFMFIWLVTLSLFILMVYGGIKNYILCRDKVKSASLLLMISISFLNVFAMELMLFPEMAMVFIVGNLTLGLSIGIALSEKKGIIRWGLCTVFLISSIGTYQSYIGIFEAFVLLGIFLKWKDNVKKRYCESVIALTVGGLVSIFDIFLIKILVKNGLIADAGRGAGLNLATIKENTVELIKYQLNFWKDADGIFPVPIMEIVGLVVVMIVCMVIKRQQTLEHKIYLGCMIFGCYVLGFAPHIIEANLVLSARSNIAVWSVIACIFILGAIYCRENKYLMRSTNIVLGCMIICSVFTMQDMAANEQAMNAVDIKEAKQICEYIKQYERKTGSEIAKIATCRDSNVTIYQSDSRYQNRQLGARIMATDYSNYRLIGYYLERNIEKVDFPDNIYTQYFKDKDWYELNLDEQAVFEGDTLYLAVY